MTLIFTTQPFAYESDFDNSIRFEKGEEDGKTVQYLTLSGTLIPSEDHNKHPVFNSDGHSYVKLVLRQEGEETTIDQFVLSYVKDTGKDNENPFDYSSGYFIGPSLVYEDLGPDLIERLSVQGGFGGVESFNENPVLNIIGGMHFSLFSGVVAPGKENALFNDLDNNDYDFSYQLGDNYGMTIRAYLELEFFESFCVKPEISVDQQKYRVHKKGKSPSEIVGTTVNNDIGIYNIQQLKYSLKVCANIADFQIAFSTSQNEVKQAVDYKNSSLEGQDSKQKKTSSFFSIKYRF